MLPKRLADAVETPICVSRGDAFDAAGNAHKRHSRIQQHVDVIGHDNVGVEIIVTKFGAAEDCGFNITGNLWIAEPNGTGPGRVQEFVGGEEMSAGVIPETLKAT